MPILPLDHPEPFAATLGVMLYPGLEESERRKARAYATHLVAERPFNDFLASGGTLPRGHLEQLLMDAGKRLDDLEKRKWGGPAVGSMVKVYFALARHHPDLASWNNAMDVVERRMGRAGISGSRTSFFEAKRRFVSVAHLWGAWSIREGEFLQRLEVGYNGYADFQSFLAEAEILRDWGQYWRPNRSKAKPPMPEEMWRVSDT